MHEEVHVRCLAGVLRIAPDQVLDRDPPQLHRWPLYIDAHRSAHLAHLETKRHTLSGAGHASRKIVKMKKTDSFACRLTSLRARRSASRATILFSGLFWNIVSCCKYSERGDVGCNAGFWEWAIAPALQHMQRLCRSHCQRPETCGPAASPALAAHIHTHTHQSHRIPILSFPLANNYCVISSVQNLQ